MSTDRLLLLQAIFVTLQIVNAGLAGILPHSPVGAFVQLVVAAVVGGFQFYLQNLGNQALPAATQSKP
jgi:hypothetical protein